MRARSEAQLADVAERVGATRPGASRCSEGRGWWAQTSWPPSVAQVLSGQSDEHGLQRGLGHREVGQGEAARLGRLDHPRDQAIGTVDLEFHPAGNGLFRVTPSSRALKTSAS